MNAYLDTRGLTTKNQVRNLGVSLESDLSFNSHVKTITKSAYYHLKNISRIRCFVSSVSTACLWSDNLNIERALEFLLLITLVNGKW